MDGLIFRCIGIDFGTSTSIVAYKDYPEVPVEEDGGEAFTADIGGTQRRFRFDGLMPTVITEEGRPFFPTLVLGTSPPLFGHNAQVVASDNPHDAGLLARDFKLDLLLPTDHEDHRAAIDLARQFIGYLYRAYESQAPKGSAVIAHTFVSYPAKWPSGAREEMIQAASDAGFPDVQGMREPEAAMRFFAAARTSEYERLFDRGLLGVGRPARVLLVDMGAGTSDFVLFDYTPQASGMGRIDGAITWPEYTTADAVARRHLGGRDIDEHLLQTLVGPALPEGSLEPDGDPARTVDRARLRDDIRVWKEQTLSPLLADGGVADWPPRRIINELQSWDWLEQRPTLSSQKLSRTQIEAAAHQSISEFACSLRDFATWRRRNLKAEEGPVEILVLTGGHSQWYWVADLLGGRLPSFESDALPLIRDDSHRLLRTPVPRQTVALGLALGPVAPRSTPRADASAWLRLSIEAETLEPIPLYSKGEVLPLMRYPLRPFRFSKQPTTKLMKGQAELMIGPTLDQAATVDRWDLTIPYWGAFMRWLDRNDGTTFDGAIGLAVIVDAEEKIHCAGIVVPDVECDTKHSYFALPAEAWNLDGLSGTLLQMYRKRRSGQLDEHGRTPQDRAETIETRP